MATVHLVCAGFGVTLAGRWREPQVRRAPAAGWVALALCAASRAEWAWTLGSRWRWISRRHGRRYLRERRGARAVAVAAARAFHESPHHPRRRHDRLGRRRPARDAEVHDLRAGTPRRVAVRAPRSDDAVPARRRGSASARRVATATPRRPATPRRRRRTQHSQPRSPPGRSCCASTGSSCAARRGRACRGR